MTFAYNRVGSAALRLAASRITIITRGTMKNHKCKRPPAFNPCGLLLPLLMIPAASVFAVQSVRNNPPVVGNHDAASIISKEPS